MQAAPAGLVFYFVLCCVQMQCFVYSLWLEAESPVKCIEYGIESRDFCEVQVINFKVS